MSKVKTGLDLLAAGPPGWMRKSNLGLLANQASVGRGYHHAVSIIDQVLPGRLKKLFGPQHGYAGEKQDNMIESAHAVEAATGRPIYSLYGPVRRPDPDMLAGLDALLIDLVDVGTRVYTFAQTMAGCLEAAAEVGLKTVILDRPNPIGGLEVEGNILKPECASFVGMFPLPMRHGLTLGELALFMSRHLPRAPEIEIIKAEGWPRNMYFSQTGLAWVYPSPNMPTPETAWVYPGQVIWEGTNVSEGRGTTRPFHLCGAPFINPRTLKEELDLLDLPGVFFRSVCFEPTFHKHQGRVCGGVEIHPLDQRSFKPYFTSLTLLEVLLRMYPEYMAWREPPYEYELERRPIDLILGDAVLRIGLEKGVSVKDLERSWQADLKIFMAEREKCLIY
ncbi:MAG: DUF1343 domain-containing protein [Thermodesulfobacteriota bacterium]